VRVEGNFQDDKEWLVERNLLTNAEDSFFSVPNTLISARKPCVPVSNMSDKPRMIRKGEIVGTLTDPQEFFDKPTTAEGYASMKQRTAIMTAVVEAKSQADAAKGNCSEAEPARIKAESEVRIRTDFGSGVPPAEGNSKEGVHVRDETGRVPNYDGVLLPNEEEAEEYGPKTAAMPEDTVYSSKDMEKLLDVGSLPGHLKPKAWEMLKRRVKAFGFDGRLGHVDAKAPIRVKAGVEPIAVPMYSSSPEKRRVIDAQLDKWFEQGVIEPSISPWSAPVVIAYRNGKPRFCVDYRKLNSVTVADEFPIPRQSEILSSLSGAQVLSSLDALAGFNQLDMAPDDIEKTAFRTHRGLAQFKRMPFGLRNGPSIFQRIMQGILSPYLWLFCLVYIDDIVVYSRNYEEHINHLDQVLGAIEKAGITLSPTKCHLFYSSILLLGHKVSRLGLSTHDEKVRAILDLERPRKVSQLQTFLGMVVYFSNFIPFYANICAPLFKLLRKGSKWQWDEEEEYAFRAAKVALQRAPLLGHPIEGKPYRLYTDASDEAAGVALQQIQPIRVRDLKGTKAYEKLQKAFDAGEAPPKLTVKLSAKVDDSDHTDCWGPSLDESIVHVERVIGYWSRSFKGAETRYSTTEREALAAKEGLVKFQPFIEGEKILLVTDHSALQWARTYENSNRRLAAWGAVFSAYAPGLEIVHRAGRIHSNVDPLSRLPRAAPEHTSPRAEEDEPILLTGDLAETQEGWLQREPAARATFSAWTIEDAIEGKKSAFATTRSQNAKREENQGENSPTVPAWTDPSTENTTSRKVEPILEVGGGDSQTMKGPTTKIPIETGEPKDKDDELDTLDPTTEYWGAVNPPPNMHVGMEESFKKSWIEAYQTDPEFKRIWKDAGITEDSWKPGQRFFRSDGGLLFFRNADYHPRLCVPKAMRNSTMAEAHEAPMESAHISPERLWAKLSSKFYWKRMKKDIEEFGDSCDVCQKIKNRNFTRFGYLTPNPIPSRPYESISLDLIVNLPWSGEYNAILVVVDRLSKHASFIPTTSGLTAQGFAELFVNHIASRFGLPDSIIADRDPRWTSDFWTTVAALIKTKMSLSSAHHPQHDGQTENVNRQLETMLRAYVSKDRDDWADWLKLLEFAYNSNIHASTGTTPFLLLYGFEPKTPLDFLLPKDRSSSSGTYGMRKDVSDYLENLQVHRENARLAIARAQHDQAKFYNRGRREIPEFKVGSRVLINPHSLEWVESKGEGAKLVQRWIGPFEVLQKINPRTYRLRLNDKYPGFPVFNLDHLKPYRETLDEFGKRITMTDTRENRIETEEYEVEKIVGKKYDKRRKQDMWLVRWKGYGPQFDTWQTRKDLRNAPEMLRAFAKSQTGA
jgi:hypothetical protein